MPASKSVARYGQRLGKVTRGAVADGPATARRESRGNRKWPLKMRANALPDLNSKFFQDFRVFLPVNLVPEED